MILAVVKGNVVSTNKTEKLCGSKLLIVEEWNIDTKAASGRPLVALDIVGAGMGELVMCVSGSSARQTEETSQKPVDLAIVGIVDQAEMNGANCYRKYPGGAEPTKDPLPTVPAPPMRRTDGSKDKAPGRAAMLVERAQPGAEKALQAKQGKIAKTAKTKE